MGIARPGTQTRVLPAKTKLRTPMDAHTNKPRTLRTTQQSLQCEVDDVATRSELHLLKLKETYGIFSDSTELIQEIRGERG